MMRKMSSERHRSENRESDEAAEAWDANDPRRRADPFAPPTEPCECFCLCCRRTFLSDGIWFQKVRGGDTLDGFWMCPTPNCGGAGFTFDIFPTDPNHPANEGWFDTSQAAVPRSWDEDEDDQEDEDWDEEFDVLGAADEPGEYDPSEPFYQSLDEWSDDQDDLEGEEWKYGLAPGERPPGHMLCDEIDEEDRQSRFDQPDERPREIDWSDRRFPDEDIPF